MTILLDEHFYPHLYIHLPQLLQQLTKSAYMNNLRKKLNT